MLYTLENETLCVLVRSHGAELRSIKERADKTEYLWGGDFAWWKYSSPILFPIVGKLHGEQYRVDGKTYELPGHGLGRISEFALEERHPDSIRFVLRWSEESLARYPWKFVLHIGYALHGSAVRVTWEVENEGETEMPFSIGAHGAYRCPIVRGEEFSDAYLAFDAAKDAVSLLTNAQGTFTHRAGVPSRGRPPAALLRTLPRRCPRLPRSPLPACDAALAPLRKIAHGDDGGLPLARHLVAEPGRRAVRLHRALVRPRRLRGLRRRIRRARGHAAPCSRQDFPCFLRHHHRRISSKRKTQGRLLFQVTIPLVLYFVSWIMR